MAIEQLLQTFSQRLNIDLPEADERGEYAFTFDDSLTMRCIPKGRDEVVLYGTVGSTPKDEQEAEEHHKRILQRNLARMKIQREILSLEPETGHIILFREVRTGDMSVADFEEIVENFLNSLDYWVTTSGAAPERVSSPFSVVFP